MEDERRKDDKSDDEKEDEQTELVGTGSKRLDEDLKIILRLCLKTSC